MTLPRRASLASRRCFAVLFVLFASLHCASAHPGAVANGRASCGVEYSRAETSYIIPEIRDAWYLRRLATCQAPVFWNAFNVTRPRQQIYVAVISPQIQRFTDRLQFHMIMYGPGVNASLPGLASVPETLPDGVTLDTELVQEGGQGLAYATSPTGFSNCDFVDTNPVMRQFSDVINGRCMEEFRISDPNFDDTLQRNTTSYSWWLYSFNHVASETTGTYYLQTWLTTRENNNYTTTGKYEITLGPWTWTGYASEATLNLAQSQGTTCSCAVNALDYKEDYLQRLGAIHETDFYNAHLPTKVCRHDDNTTTTVTTSTTTTNNNNACGTIPQQPYLSKGSSVEWSGLFTLTKGRNYSWTFRSYYLTGEGGYQYPDPGMWVYITNTTDDTVNAVAAVANQALTTAVDTIDNPNDGQVVTHGQAIVLNTPQWIVFTNPQQAVSTMVQIRVPDSLPDTANLAIFTQHVPMEFMAHFLVDTNTSDYIFPISSTLYFDDSVVDNNATASPTDSSTTALTGSPSTAATTFISFSVLLVSCTLSVTNTIMAS